eukprot:TRINITY_DN12776_c0_g2_i1.p1 TRINITY_DN12776_c0_g2~~TRINITY_DN12776_c0_g2_i1.p1  ORF type:complete len:897 (+),score=113.76 TRINITY_DN12776_c0_g2_i1:211-2901(+)
MSGDIPPVTPPRAPRRIVGPPHQTPPLKREAWTSQGSEDVMAQRLIPEGPVEQDRERSCRGVFLSAMGVVYFMAFTSYYIQYPGLLGADGLLPAAPFWKQVRDSRLQAVRANQPVELDLRAALGWWSNGVGQSMGLTRLEERIPRIVLSPPGERARTFRGFLSFPTWLWFLTGENGLHPDQALEGLALSGAMLSVMATLGFHHVALFALLYMNYLSLFLLGQRWTGFQWDIFLLETGAVLLPYCSITTVRARKAKPPAAWLLRLLIVKFMYMNGVVKVQASCPTWKHLTALEYHFASTCIPTAEAWAVHQLPPFILRLATAFMFLVELPGAFLLLFPVKSVRRVGVFAQAALQVGIMATGNYNWFNLQTIALLLPAWDADDYGDDDGASASSFLHLGLLPARAWSWFWSGWSGCAAGIGIGFGFLGWAFGKMFGIYHGNFVAPLGFGDVTAWFVTAVAAPRTTVYSAWQIFFGDYLRIEALFGRKEVDTLTDRLLSSWSMNVVFALIFAACIRHAAAPMCSWAHLGCLRRAFAIGQCAGRLGNMLLLLPLAVVCLLPIESLGRPAHVPFRHAVAPLKEALTPWHVTSGYGLFRRMTGVGNAPKDAKGWGALPPSVVAVPGLVVEGSDDGQRWREIPFRYTPGNTTKQPRRTAPHQPRLDWQMWFAALGSYQNNPWFVHLIYKLLAGGGPALELLDVDAYTWKDRDPPKLIRAILFHYDFTRLDTPWARSIPGTKLLPVRSNKQEKVWKQWWTRSSQGTYLPPVSEESLSEVIRSQGWPVGHAARDAAIAAARDCKPANRGGPVLGTWCDIVITARQFFGAAAAKRSGWFFYSRLLRQIWSGASVVFFLDVNLVLILGSLLVPVVVTKLLARFCCRRAAAATAVPRRWRPHGRIKDD